MEKNKKNLIDILIWLIITSSIIAFFTLIIQLTYIPSDSMNPFLYQGDLCIMNRLAKNFERYDIVTFNPPIKGEKNLFIKRVIGLPGETIIVRDGHVYLAKDENDESSWEILDESFLLEDMKPGKGDGVYKVPEDSYFLLGDNRNNSNDARFWSEHFVKKDEISAKYLFRIPLADEHRK